MEQTNSISKDFLKADFSLIFLGGIHGVGKTTVCDRIFKSAGYYCTTASSLIKAHGIRSDKNKRVECIDSNQLALIEQIDLEKKRHACLLIDGHYCLINSGDEFEPIKIKFFCKINPDIFLLLKDCSDKILERLKKRDNTKWNKSLVEAFQKTEEQHAHYIASELNIPLYIISNEEAAPP